MISLQYFANKSVQISPNNNKMDIFKIFTKRAVEKCPIWNFQTPRKPRNSKNKSGNNIAGHPVNSCLFVCLSLLPNLVSIRFIHNTGCPTILYTLLFFEFLGFLGVQKFHLGHFSTAHFVQISKISNFLLFGEIWTEILAKYYREVILKVNIFWLLINKAVQPS